MGKKGYNWKSRAVANVEVDNSTTKEIALDIKHRVEDYDSCNALVLPPQKRETKNIDKKITTTRLLSKKRRKQLEKIVERKKKKLQRATLLEDLVKVQVSSAELQQYVSLTSLQNKGLKRHFRELEIPVEKLKRKADNEEESDSIKTTVNSIKMSKKKRLALLDSVKQDEAKLDPNIVGFESSDNSSDDSNEDDSDNEEENAASVLDNNVTFNIETSESTKINEKKNEKSLMKDTEKETISDKSQKFTKSAKEVEQQNIIPKVHIPAVFIPVNRKPEIQAARMKLPIVVEEQIIVETINDNPIVIITGETGSGKTTQVPQFLYEAGYAQNKLIGITEPRRVAAMSMSKRVAEELNLSKKEVSYLIRFEGNVTEETKIKFMTDGVLLKEIQSDFLLTKYSVIILDEAHERSVYTDILIGLLSRIVPLRNSRGNPLKLIIMSATLSVKEFIENTRLFKIKPPVIEVKARQFLVKMHFNKRTSKDYVNEALRKAIKIHTRLPEGGILIFLTGQQEVHTVVRKLRKSFPLKKNKQPQVKVVKDSEKYEMSDKEHSGKDESDDDFDAQEALRRNKRRQKKQLILPTINLDDYSVNPTDDTHEDLINAQDDEDNLDENEDEDEDVIDFKGLTNAQPLWVLPLYSLLPGHKQARVFEPPPEGCRLCVVSTNVAETSLTIPNIRYVVDSGRCKIRMYDKVTGVSTYHISYVSKAAATQRAGRAGRTRPGHCYRLYSSAVYDNDFEEYSQSEIQRKSVDDLLLQMKAMNIDKVVNFPFPTPPDIVQLKSAEKRLTILEALRPPSKKPEEIYCAKITPLGRSIAAFPVSPRYGKMLALSHQYNLSKYTICMVAALSVQEVLIEAFDVERSASNSKWLQMRRYWAGIGNNLLLGDPMVLIRAIGTAEYAGSKGKLLSFCEENGLRHKAVVEIKKLRQQLTNEINLNVPNLNLIIDPKMPLPTDMEAKLLRQIVLAGMADQVAKKVLPDEVTEDQDKAKWKHAYRTPEMEEPVFMHSTCVLRKTSPEWVVYQEVYETNKMYMRGVTAIEPEWLPKFAPTLCNLSEPLVDPPPRYNQGTGKIICRVSGTFGKAGWTLPSMDIEHPFTVDGVKWFAYFFLEGQVCPKLKQFVPSLLTTPGSITKSWAKLIPRTQVIVQTLQSQGVMSKDKLVEIWGSDKKCKYFENMQFYKKLFKKLYGIERNIRNGNYVFVRVLLSAYQKWLPESAHAEVTQLWPPCN